MRILTLGALCALTMVVYAEPAKESLALAKFETGLKAYNAKQWADALPAFQASLELQPSPNTRLYIGRCHLQLGHLASAYTSLELAAREAQDRLTATGERRYGATRDAAAGEATAIEGRVPHLTLAVVAGLPPDFALELDGAPVAASGWGVASPIDPGHHEVRATGHRLAPWKQAIDVAEGAAVRVDVTPARLPTATVSFGFQARPAGLAVMLDGRPLDPAELGHALELDPGRHTVEVAAPGYRTWRWAGALGDGQTAPLAVALTPDVKNTTFIREHKAARLPRWVFFTVGGAGALALAGGSVFALQAKSIADSEKAKAPLLRDPARKAEVTSKARTANILFVTGGVLAAGAVVVGVYTQWHAARKEPARRALEVGPWVDADAAGLLAGGSF
jgi:hypothetical protein